jgi:hypothetical protein
LVRFLFHTSPPGVLFFCGVRLCRFLTHTFIQTVCTWLLFSLFSFIIIVFLHG